MQTGSLGSCRSTIELHPQSVNNPLIFRNYLKRAATIGSTMQARNSMEKHDTEPKIPQKSRSAEWLAIAEAAEAATGPDREIDARIGAALDICHGSVSVREWGKIARSLTHDMLPPYTASLDAITAAIGPEMTWEVLSTGWARIEEPGRGFEGVAATPALALCAAFARAMAAKARSDALSELAAMDGEHL